MIRDITGYTRIKRYVARFHAYFSIKIEEEEIYIWIYIYVFFLIVGVLHGPLPTKDGLLQGVQQQEGDQPYQYVITLHYSKTL